MIDLHTHSLFSDGELLPSELIRRASVIGCQAVAITDHADSSNLDWVIPRVVRVCQDLKAHWQVRAIPGVELTHIPPDLISPLTVRARTLGAQIVLVHGETIVEPVPPGTNQQAIAAGVDILAHPGLIAEEEVVLAREKGVFLEITARKGHSLTNGHVARLAKKVGASLVLNTDTHAPDDLISQDYALKIALGAGLTNEDFERMQENAWKILDRMS
jgi:histidinol phosphatase-like PHP family hydrolase